MCDAFTGGGRFAQRVRLRVCHGGGRRGLRPAGGPRAVQTRAALPGEGPCGRGRDDAPAGRARRRAHAPPRAADKPDLRPRARRGLRPRRDTHPALCPSRLALAIERPRSVCCLAGNVGALVRTAAAAAVDAIVLVGAQSADARARPSSQQDTPKSIFLGDPYLFLSLSLSLSLSHGNRLVSAQNWGSSPRPLRPRFQRTRPKEREKSTAGGPHRSLDVRRSLAVRTRTFRDAGGRRRRCAPRWAPRCACPSSSVPADGPRQTSSCEGAGSCACAAPTQRPDPRRTTPSTGPPPHSSEAASAHIGKRESARVRALLGPKSALSMSHGALNVSRLPKTPSSPLGSLGRRRRGRAFAGAHRRLRRRRRQTPAWFPTPPLSRDPPRPSLFCDFCAQAAADATLSRVHIPIANVESLNAAVAGSVILLDARRQLRLADPGASLPA